MGASQDTLLGPVIRSTRDYPLEQSRDDTQRFDQVNDNGVKEGPSESPDLQLESDSQAGRFSQVLVR